MSYQAFRLSLALGLLATSAHAQSVTGALQDFDLFGTWAIECNQIPSPTNEYSIFRVAAFGAVQLRNDFGRDYDEMVYRIIGARRLGPDRLTLRQVLTTDTRIVLDTVMLKSDDRVRVWSSRGLDGTTLVRDGTIPMSNGHETRWVVRCQGRWTGDGAPVTDIRFAPEQRLRGKLQP
jgi:hypothetical protein